jgi:eukaryotic-like serine/threonine-protein kinase
MPAEGTDGFPSPFGRYTLTERLATGGMAEVFKAKISSAHGFEKLLVIKRILPNLAADKNFVAMFIDEAKLTAQLIHPKIVQVIDFGEVKGQYFIALEFIDGFDALALLRAAASKQMRLPFPIAMFVSMEVLDALDYAHHAGDAEGKPMHLVHRDISPSNVFIARRGDVKLGDFGIAHAQQRESKTQAGTLKGKYGYMSPEQVLGNTLDGRSDLFAVGILLAEMLMGRRLFTAPNDLDVLLMVRDGRLERLDKYARDLPPALDQLLRKALAKKPADRFETAAEFRDVLGDLLFRWGKRVTPADVGRLAAALLDKSNEPSAALLEQLKRWRVEPEGAAAAPAVPAPVMDPPSAPVRQTSSPGSVPSAGGSNPGGQFGAAPSLRRGSVREAGPRTPGPVAGATPTPPVESDHSLEIVVDDGRAAVAAAPGGGQANLQANLAALDNLLSQPLSVVALDKYEMPSRVPSGARRPATGAAPPAAAPTGTPAADRAPDSAAELTSITPMRILTELAAARETGLLRLDLPGQVKDLYLVMGAPESASSSLAGGRFGDWLVARGLLRPQQLQAATAQLPRFAGKLADALPGLGMLRAADVFRLQAEFVRERVLELFPLSEGRASFYRELRNPFESFALGLEPFELIGAGVLTLPLEYLQRRYRPLLDQRPVAFPPARFDPEVFKLGPTPHDLLGMLDRTRTLRAWLTGFQSTEERVTFLRTLYLLLESGLAGIGP